MTTPAHDWTWNEVDKNPRIGPTFDSNNGSMLLPNSLTFNSPEIPAFPVFIALALNEAAVEAGYGYFYCSMRPNEQNGDLFFCMKDWTDTDKTNFWAKPHSKRWADCNLKNVERDAFLLPISLGLKVEIGPRFVECITDPDVAPRFSVLKGSWFTLNYESFQDKYSMRPHGFTMPMIKKHFDFDTEVDNRRPHVQIKTDFAAYRRLHLDNVMTDHEHLVKFLAEHWILLYELLDVCSLDADSERGGVNNEDTIILPPENFDMWHR